MPRRGITVETARRMARQEPALTVGCVTGTKGRCDDVAVRWAKSVGKRSVIATVAAPANLETWNGTTRRALVAWHSDAPIGVAWISSELFEERSLGLRLELASEEVWLHSAFVVPSHRKQGVYRRILRCAMNTLRDEGYRRLLVGVAIGNEPSQRAHRTVGATRIGGIAAARSGRLSLCVATGLVHCSSGGRVGVASRLTYGSRGDSGAAPRVDAH